MMMTCYKMLTEENDHEGETWHHFIPLDGNQQAIDRIWELLNSEDSEVEPFTLKDQTYTEEQVRLLCAQEDTTSYMSTYTRLEGVLVLPSDISDKNCTKVVLEECLYKGGIRAWVHGPTVADLQKELAAIDNLFRDRLTLVDFPTRIEKLSFVMKVLERADPKGDFAKEVSKR